MKRYLIITGLFLALLVFCSKSCETPENEQAQKREIVFQATLDSINSSFVSDNLSEQMLRSFEVKAKQKLTDFADYLQICTDKSLDESFREHAQQMIHDLFISDSVYIDLHVPNEIKGKAKTINDFLKMTAGSEENFIGIMFDSIVLSEPLHKINDLSYAGSLKFLQRYELLSSRNTTISHSIDKEVEIIATRVKKPFGSDTLKIWTVLLGNIK